MSFPAWMRQIKGNAVHWKCEICGKRFADGFLLEFHHLTPTSAGGQDLFNNMQCLCVYCHYKAHLALRLRNIDHPSSASIILARFNRTGGGRTRKWLEDNNWPKDW